MFGAYLAITIQYLIKISDRTEMCIAHLNPAPRLLFCNSVSSWSGGYPRKTGPLKTICGTALKVSAGVASCAGARGGGWLKNGGALGVIGSANGSGLVSSPALCSGVFPIAR
jgi:hypothetical protein